MSTNETPRCKLSGTDGNVFFLAARVGKTLKRAGMYDKAAEFYAKLDKTQSYDEALRLMMEYVEVE